MPIATYINDLVGSPIEVITTYTGSDGVPVPNFKLQMNSGLVTTEFSYTLMIFMNQATGKDGSMRTISEKIEAEIIRDFGNPLVIEDEKYIWKFRATPKHITFLDKTHVTDEKGNQWPYGLSAQRTILSADKLRIDNSNSTTAETKHSYSKGCTRVYIVASYSL